MPDDAPVSRRLGPVPIFNSSYGEGPVVVYEFGPDAVIGRRFRVVNLRGQTIEVIEPNVEQGRFFSKIAKRSRMIVRGVRGANSPDFLNFERVNLENNETNPVALDLLGMPFTLASQAKISDDGKTVVYMSSERNITNAPYNLIPQIYAWREQTGRIQLVSKYSDGRPSIGLLKDVHFDVSSDGRYVVWSARDVMLGGLEEFGNEFTTVAFYISDLHTGQTRYAAKDLVGRLGGRFGICETFGTPSNFNDFFLSPITRNPNCATISGNGKVLAFSSLSDRWTTGDLPYQNLPNPLTVNPRYLDVFIVDTDPISLPITQVPSTFPWTLALMSITLIGFALISIRRR